MAAEFVVFPTLLYVTQPGGSDNPCTLMKMSQETATSTPVCKMVIQVSQAVRALWWLELPNVESIIDPALINLNF